MEEDNSNYFLYSDTLSLDNFNFNIEELDDNLVEYFVNRFILTHRDSACPKYDCKEIIRIFSKYSSNSLKYIKEIVERMAIILYNRQESIEVIYKFIEKYHSNIIKSTFYNSDDFIDIYDLFIKNVDDMNYIVEIVIHYNDNNIHYYSVYIPFEKALKTSKDKLRKLIRCTLDRIYTKTRSHKLLFDYILYNTDPDIEIVNEIISICDIEIMDLNANHPCVMKYLNKLKEENV